MDEDVNLTNALGEWRRRPLPKVAAAPKPAPVAKPAEVITAVAQVTPQRSRERELQVDWFQWFAYGVAAAFFIVQLLLLGVLDFRR